MNIAKFSVKQPVLVNLLTIFLIVAGILSLSRLPREMFPVITTGKIQVTAIYPGVSPEEMESLVGIKIERQIKDIQGIKKMVTASAEGLMALTVETDEDLSAQEVSKVALDIQAALGRITDFPADMDAPVVQEMKMEVPIVYMGINSRLPEVETRALAKALRDELEKLKDVSTVTLVGLRDLEIKVEVSPEQLRAHGLDITRVMGAIQKRKMNIPGGSVKLPRGEYLIRVMGKVNTAKEIGDIIVSAGPSGIIRVKDVALVHEGLSEPEILTKVNGNRSIYLVINKKPKGDAIRIMNAVNDHLRQWRERVPEGVETRILFDSTKYIKARQQTLYSNGAMGLVLVVVILLLFLSFKTALVTALGIPVAFFGTFIVMHFLGISMNMMAMFGLIMALGMIVDDAIVVVENIYRRIMGGMAPRAAAVKGASEVFWPVIGSVSTTVIAFATMTVMPGEMGKILVVIPVVVAIALAISLLEALFVLPSHMAEWVRAPKGRATTGDASMEARWFLVFRSGFAKVLRVVTRWWPVSVGLFVALFAFIMGPVVKSMEFVPFPSTTVKQVSIEVETTPGSKLEYTEAALRPLEAEILKATKGEVDSHFCVVGSIVRGHSSLSGSHLATCTVNFANDGKTSPRSTAALITRWRRLMRDNSKVDKVAFKMTRGGPPAGTPIEIRIKGEDLAKAKELAQQVQKYALTIPGVTDIADDASVGKQELRIQLDYERAALYGFDTATVGLMVRYIFAGGAATKIQRSDEDINIVVRYPGSRRTTIKELENLELLSPVTGQRVALRAFAEIKESVGAGRLTRVDQTPTVTVTGDIDTTVTNTTRVARVLKKYVSDLAAANPRYSFEQGGEVETSNELMDSILLAALLALLGIYIILATIFQSFLQPFIVLVAVPFGAVGVIIGLKVHGEPISMMSLMGVVGLLGVVVNDSLVMVDFINKAVLKGLPIAKAVVEGGRLRLRPVILTSLTTIFGLLPMALGTFGSEEFLAPMAIAMVWGLAFSTLLTLFLVPSVYLMLDWMKRMALRPFGILHRTLEGEKK